MISLPFSAVLPQVPAPWDLPGWAGSPGLPEGTAAVHRFCPARFPGSSRSVRIPSGQGMYAVHHGHMYPHTVQMLRLPAASGSLLPCLPDAYRYSPAWSFGATTGLNIMPQWSQQSETNYTGFIMDFALTARYHF